MHDATKNEIVRLREEGKSLRAIAAKVGTSHVTVGAVLKQCRPELLSVAAIKNIRESKISLYVTELRRTMTYPAICKRVGIPEKRVRKLVRKIRPSAIGTAKQGRRAYGQNPEARDKKIIALKRQGLTHAKIAEALVISHSTITKVLLRDAPELISARGTEERDIRMVALLAEGIPMRKVAEIFKTGIYNVRRIAQKKRVAAMIQAAKEKERSDGN